MIKCWFPDFYTDAHRDRYWANILVGEFAHQGIEMYPNATDTEMDCVFCGSFLRSQDTIRQVNKNSRLKGKVFHYCWDLYPWQLNGEERPSYPYPTWWKEYRHHLNDARAVFVPSQCTVDRVKEFTTQQHITVVKAPIHVFDEPTWDGGYVLNPVRDYPDANRHAVEEACKRLGVPYKQSGNNLPWNEFKKVVAGASLIVSAQEEASTGGLTLLEGYALGKLVLVSNSPRHGGRDYFGDRAATFQWDQPASLDNMIRNLLHFRKENPDWKPPECMDWVTRTYNDREFAKQIADTIKERL